MRLIETRLAGLVLIEPDVHSDGRGFFLETFREARYTDMGVEARWVQDNHSRSMIGTVRGLHFQSEPGQPKLVRVARGAAWDVVVDLRRSSPTFGAWESFELDDERHRQLFIPIGFAHGFCVLTDIVDVVYKVGSPYEPATERGLAWDDPDVGIRWPTAQPILSDRDRRNPRLSELTATLPDW